MFIYSMRANTLKFFAVICLALTALITLVAFVPTYVTNNDSVQADASISYNYEKIKSNEDRINFLKQFGWDVASEPIKEQQVTIPKDFDKVFAAYNEIQRKQGLDLASFKKKTVSINGKLFCTQMSFLCGKNKKYVKDEKEPQGDDKRIASRCQFGL